MPLLSLKTSVSIDEDKRSQLMASLSELMAKDTSKPERYVMVILESEPIHMSGQSGAAAFGDIRGIGGFLPVVTQKLSRDVSHLLHKELGIPPERIYLNFSEVAATHWGWNGDTFG